MTGRRTQMRKVIVGAALLAGIALAVRRFGPRLTKSAMAHCEAMFENMPEDFPPKRMMSSIEEIRRQNAQILEHLEAEREQPALSAVN
jgi:hypothetical protein